MYKRILSLIAFFILMHPAFPQIHPAIEKALRDPDRRDKEAKADVFALRKITIHSSGNVQSTSQKARPVKK